MSRTLIGAPKSASAAGLGPRAASLAIATLVAGYWYLAWRAGTMNPEAPLLSAMVYGLELFGFGALALSLAWLSRTVTRAPGWSVAKGEVDLFLVAYGVSAAALRRSLAAAAQVRGARVTVVGGGDAGKALAGAFGAAHAPSRREALTRARGDFIAVFRGDTAPAPEFVERTLGYFDDPHVGFVQTDSEAAQRARPLWAELLLGAPAPMSAAAQASRDACGAVLMDESGAMIRRAALKRIGGFVSGGASSLRTSLKLHKAGFVSVFHRERLGACVADNDARAARTRSFADRAARTWLREGVVVRGGGLTLQQRACYLAAFMSVTDAPRAAAFAALPVLALCLGVAPVAALDGALALHFAPYALMSLALAAVLRREPAVWRRAFKWIAPLRAPARPAPLGVVEQARDVAAPRAMRAAPRGSEVWLWAVIGLEAFALGVGATRLAVHAHFDAALVGLCGAWAMVAAGAAIAALSARRRLRADRRGDERRTVDLAVELHAPSGGWRAVRAIDATPGGLRLAAPLGLDVAAGQKVEAYVWAGGARVAATLRVRHRAAAWAEAGVQRLELGCELIWAAAADQDALCLALYGAEASNENAPAMVRSESAA